MKKSSVRYDVALVEGTEASHQLRRDGVPLHEPLALAGSALREIADALNAEERLGGVEQCPATANMRIERCQRTAGHDGEHRWLAKARASR